MRKILTAFACLALAACGTLGTTATSPPAPLAQTQIDEKALVVAFEAFETVLDTVDALIAAGVVKPGTPRAIKIADALETTKLALNAARAAQQAGQSTSYEDALRRASSALSLARTALKGN